MSLAILFQFLCAQHVSDINMSETCWAHKQWNKIASDIKLIFFSSTITMMHGPINIRLPLCIRPALSTYYLYITKHGFLYEIMH